DALRCAVEQASCNAQPTTVVALLPSRTTTGAQTLAAIAQLQSVAAAELPPTVANTFGETLPTINNNISIIEASPFLTATTLQSPKIGVLCEVHPCRDLVIHFPGEEPISSDEDDKE
uniref:Uncharacterized protein n=1 Tax=Romanomermis culicivorax TaxID=13658 RepID=A0A915IM63_ROMCU